MAALVNFNLTFPNLKNEQQTINLTEGNMLFVLGANGTGKSGLMHRLYSQNIHTAKRISAHRQTWFTSNAMDFTSRSRENKENAILDFDAHIRSRWQDIYSSDRSQVVVFDLINAQNIRARQIAVAMDSKQFEYAKELSEKDAPLKILNRLLKISNLPIEISIKENEKVFASKNGSPLYSIAELSDGERNAILIAADVLTAKKHSLFIIDEPERHLHRSIISPLLTALFQQRKDCKFIIATHDIGLPLDNPEADVLLVRGCQWSGPGIVGWDTDLVKSAEQISPQIKQDILGSRRILLFVEGDKNSLDLQIYQILFPEVSVISQGNCNDVERAVQGFSTTGSLHWVKAIGLTDSDDRSASDINELKEKNVYALPCYSVESIYYSLEIIKKMAEKSAAMYGGSSSDLVNKASTALLNALTGHKERLCARLCERKIRRKIVPPDWRKIQSEPNFNINLPLATPFHEEIKRFDSFVENKDIASIISRYPIRETPALDEIASSLRFSDRRSYEDAARKALMDDTGFKNQIRAKFGDLDQAIASNTV